LSLSRTISSGTLFRRVDGSDLPASKNQLLSIVIKSRSNVLSFCKRSVDKFQKQRIYEVPDVVKKRLDNYHLPGHFEPLVYLFHHAGLIDKNDLRSKYDKDLLLKDAKDALLKAKDDYSKKVFDSRKFTPDFVSHSAGYLINNLFTGGSPLPRIKLASDREFI
jgi:hypothetical protein